MIPFPTRRTALELLGKLVEDYEKARFKFRQPGPIEAILFCIQQRPWTRT